MLDEKYYRKEDLVGKLVYSSKLLSAGKVADVGYSKSGDIAIIVKQKNKEKIIPFTGINDIGDIILLLPESESNDESQVTTNQRLEENNVEIEESNIEEKSITQTQHPEVARPNFDEESPSKLKKSAKVKECPKCSRENKSTAKFCVKCGYSFSV